MHNGDVLGDEGRKALDACVKVTIVGKPETRRYDWNAALDRLHACYQGKWPSEVYRWSQFEKHGTYNIVDIHDALVKFDNMSLYVDKYPKEEPGSDKLRDVIDKRRADVERELEEARTDPDGRHRYSWIVAQRRVKDCYAWKFSTCHYLLQGVLNRSNDFNIIDIHKAVHFWDAEDKRSFRVHDSKRAEVEKEYAEAIAAADKNIQHTLHKYSRDEAEKRVRGCYMHSPSYCLDLANILPVKMDDSGMREMAQSYDIFDIHKVLAYVDGKKKLDKYPEEGPGSDELKKLIDEHRDDMNKEYQQATSAMGIKTSQHKYSWHEAELRVRDCFVGSFLEDTDIFPTKKGQSGIPKVYQTFDIFDIKEALHHFDSRKLFKKYPEEGPEYDKIKQWVDKQRAGIESEYITATTNIEIEHGSGFIVHDHFIITNKHVIETYLDETENYEIRISNAAIDDLPCKVAHYDPGKDLALLYCPELNLEQSGICPLQLSNQSLLPAGMSIFSFGYPMSHTGKTALFMNGNVSGSKETLAGHSMVVLNCALNSGNSGGPVLCWVNGQLKVVGVATQKHFKEILTLEERETIEKIRKSLETSAIPDLKDGDLCNTPMFLLTLKLYDALETHSQFNLSNALPGHLVVEFIKNSISKYTGEDKEELAEIVNLSPNDSVNILPSDGPLSALFKSAINIIFRYR